MLPQLASSLYPLHLVTHSNVVLIKTLERSSNLTYAKNIVLPQKESEHLIYWD